MGNNRDKILLYRRRQYVKYAIAQSKKSTTEVVKILSNQLFITERTIYKDLAS